MDEISASAQVIIEDWRPFRSLVYAKGWLRGYRRAVQSLNDRQDVWGEVLDLLALVVNDPLRLAKVRRVTRVDGDGIPTEVTEQTESLPGAFDGELQGYLTVLRAALGSVKFIIPSAGLPAGEEMQRIAAALSD